MQGARMGRATRVWMVAASLAVTAVSIRAQAPASASTAAASDAQPPAQAVEGGRLHGVVKSGNVPLPGVTVTAQNTLSGKKYSTVTDITGTWSLNLPQNGRYVIRTQFAAFAPSSKEALLNAASHDQAVDFELMLASRAAEQEQRAGAEVDLQAAESMIQQFAGNGAGNLSVLNAISGDVETGNGAVGLSGAALPTIASNTDFSSESVSISGQSGQVSPLAGIDIDRIRDAMEAYRAANPGQGRPEAGGLFGGGGGRFNFRNFNPAQPHGAIFWMGSNSALNAQPFALRGQAKPQPASGTN